MFAGTDPGGGGGASRWSPPPPPPFFFCFLFPIQIAPSKWLDPPPPPPPPPPAPFYNSWICPWVAMHVAADSGLGVGALL